MNWSEVHSVFQTELCSAVTVVSAELQTVQNTQSAIKNYAIRTAYKFDTLHRISKNVPHLACYNFDIHEWILVFFGSNVIDKVGNQKSLYYATSNNLCFCTTWQNGETRKSHFHSIGLCYMHNAHVRCLSERKKLSSVMCLIASNIC